MIIAVRIAHYVRNAGLSGAHDESLPTSCCPPGPVHPLQKITWMVSSDSVLVMTT